MKTESLSKTPEFREGRTVRVYSGTCFTRVRLLPTDKTVHCSRRVSLRCGRCNRTYCEECYWEHKPLCDLSSRNGHGCGRARAPHSATVGFPCQCTEVSLMDYPESLLDKTCYA